MPQEATAEEMNAYDDLVRSLQQPGGEATWFRSPAR